MSDDNVQKAVLRPQNRLSDDRSVSMSNALTRAGHGLTLSEKRLIALALTKVNSFKSVFGSMSTTKISAREYAQAFEVDEDTAYRQLETAGHNLFNRKITFFAPLHKRVGQTPNEPMIPRKLHTTKTEMRWVGEVKYAKGEGWVELWWWPKVVPHLLGLKKEFTTYKLVQASSLRSIYSWRLLELLTSHQRGWIEIAVEDFAVSMDAPIKHSQNFAKIRTKIIEPAVKELIEKDGWLISWQAIKTRRKVTSLRFEWKRNPQARFDF